MVTADGTETASLGKRGRNRRGQRQRHRIRQMSRRLVKSGEMPEGPCLLCGSEEGLTIHHVGPMRPDRFVFLCGSCHERAHQPVYRIVRVPITSGQFSVRPAAVVQRRKVVCRG